MKTRASSPRRSAPGPILFWALAALLLQPALPVPGGPGLRAALQDAGREGEPHPEAVEAIGRLKSPFCPGLMLEVCPSPQAAELRDTIENLARSGVASDSIVEWTLATYGEEWRAVPKTEGTGLYAWIIPPLALVLGVGAVVVALRHLRGEDDGRGPEEEAELSDEEERRLARAMEELERG